MSSGVVSIRGVGTQIHGYIVRIPIHVAAEFRKQTSINTILGTSKDQLSYELTVDRQVRLDVQKRADQF